MKKSIPAETKIREEAAKAALSAVYLSYPPDAWFTVDHVTLLEGRTVRGLVKSLALAPDTVPPMKRAPRTRRYRLLKRDYDNWKARVAAEEKK